MSQTKQTSDVIKTLHQRYVKNKKRRLNYIEQEKTRVEIAQKIYELRTRAKLSQAELAQRIGTKQSVISRLEDAEYNGHTLKMLEKIALAVHCYLTVDFIPQDDKFVLAM